MSWTGDSCGPPGKKEERPFVGLLAACCTCPVRSQLSFDSLRPRRKWIANRGQARHLFGPRRVCKEERKKKKVSQLYSLGGVERKNVAEQGVLSRPDVSIEEIRTLIGKDPHPGGFASFDRRAIVLRARRLEAGRIITAAEGVAVLRSFAG